MTQKTVAAQPTMEDLLKRVADDKKIVKGDKISGKIIHISKGEVQMDIETIGLGLVRGKELYNDEYISLLKLGETVEAVVVDLDNERGMLELSFRAIGKEKIWGEVVKMYETKSTIEAKIRDVNRGGFLVKVGGVYGFLPASLLSPTHAIKQNSSSESNNLVNQMKKLIGQSFHVKIISINVEQDTVVVSEKAVSDEIANVKLSQYKQGDIVSGEVVGVVDFGLFVRFDEGIDGLVHVSEISWKKIDKPGDEYKPGDQVKAKIIEIDSENRINLSIKQTLENPWSKFKKKAKVGDTFKGNIVKIVSFGVIVASTDDIQGLCHISQLSQDLIDSPSKIHDLVKIGEEKEFTILSVVDDKLQLTLLPIKEAQAREEDQRMQLVEKATNEDLKQQVEKVIETQADETLEEAKPKKLKKKAE
jgi:small subunit ribosomal protein S1